MGGTKNKGKGGGGGGHHRNRNPEQREKITRDPGVPGNDLRRAGERLATKAQNRANKHSFHTGHNGIFGNAGGMARQIAERKEAEEQARAAAAQGGQAFAEEEKDDGAEETIDPVERERQQRRKVSEMHALALNATRKQTQHSDMDNFLQGGNDKSGADGGEYEHDAGTHGGAKVKDNSYHRFYTSFQKTLDSSDILLEVLDARDPLGCQLKKIEQTVESQFGDSKQIVVILNKADLVPDDVLQAWVEYFKTDEQREYVVPFTAAKNAKSAIRAIENSDEDEESDEDGGNNNGGGGIGVGGSSMVGQIGRQAGIAKLFGVLRKIARGEGGARKHVSVGVIGYPNVGKSSIINALKRKHVVGVGNTPGFTTGNQEVDLRSDIKILDCPGVVEPGKDTGDVVLRNAVKVDQLADPLCAVERLCQRCKLEDLAAVYGIDHSTCAQLKTPQQFVKAVGYRRGRVRQGGAVDEDETSRIILNDWNDGRIGYFTMPPEASSVLPAHINVAGRPDAMNEHDDEQTKAVTVIKTLSTGMGVDGLPTFHLRLTEAGGNNSKKRRQHGGGGGGGGLDSRRKRQ